jgi:hypothetical protein
MLVEAVSESAAESWRWIKDEGGARWHAVAVFQPISLTILIFLT